MGKQNTPLILGFVNNAARNNFNVSQKQVQNKNNQQKAAKPQDQQQQRWTVVNKKANNKGTQTFQSWADVASRNTKNEIQKQSSWTNVVKQNKNQQRPKSFQQQQQQQQQQKSKQQRKQQKQRKNNDIDDDDVQPTWGWYPASKYEAELKIFNQKVSKSNRQANNRVQNRQQSKQQRLRNSVMMNNKAKREAQALKNAQELKKNFNLLRNINQLYDAYNLSLPSENKRGAWISANKVGGNKILSVATLFAIRNAPVVRGDKKPFVQRNGQIIFNNKCIRRAVEGRFTGHKKFRGNRVLTNIPEKWFTKENSYTCIPEKYSDINGPKRTERCYSFKGVY